MNKTLSLHQDLKLLAVFFLLTVQFGAFGGEEAKRPSGSPTGTDKAQQDKGLSVLADKPSLSRQIDQAVNLTHLGPGMPASRDEEFLRRIYLDLIGRGPTVLEICAYEGRLAASPGSSSLARSELIDDLLARGEFSRYFAKVLEVMITERREDNISMMGFRGWIQGWLGERRPLNELFLEVLAADGTAADSRPAAGFILNRNADPHLVSRDLGRIYFGRDVQCAQCHDHPLVPDYKQSEYFGLFSFVNRSYLFMDEKRGGAQLLGEKGEGMTEFASVFRPRDGKKVAQPMLPMAIAVDAGPESAEEAEAYLVAPGKDSRAVPRHSRRQQLAVLATHPENDCFNRNLANRLWAVLMGMGIVHPVDMHHSENPPASAALLRLLAEGLVDCGYDLREFLRQVARSDAYQRSVEMPDLRPWAGPLGGTAALQVEVAKLSENLRGLDPIIKSLDAEVSLVTQRLQGYQSDFNRLQQRREEARKKGQQLGEQRDKEKAALAALQANRAREISLINALKAAAQETDKAIQLKSGDKELAANRAQLDSRIATADKARAAIDEQLPRQGKVVDQAGRLAEDQRLQVLALGDRRLALGEFAAEARGALRRLQRQRQEQQDRQADLQQQKERIGALQSWLSLRDKARTAAATGRASEAAALEIQLGLIQESLFETWRRTFSLRRVRPLAPEQMAGATYAALDLGRPAREKALADWRASIKDTAEREDEGKRKAFVEAAIADHMWGALEKVVMRRFSAPAGAPQDGFFSTVDQALMMMNDPMVQNWLKASQGNLVDRLVALEDPDQLARELYLGIVSRQPDARERAMVRDLLARHAGERAVIVRELVWGLLASAEFRFIL